MEPLYRLIDIYSYKLSKEEFVFLEAEFFSHICKELKKIFKKQHAEYFSLIKFTIEMEDIMLEENFIRLVINDILSTEEYTLEGIAHYMNIHEDVIHEVISGRNTNPSAILLRRTIDLHRSVRTNFYHELMKKIKLNDLE